MDELIFKKPDVNVLEAEYKRLLGYPDNYELKEKSFELADWARNWYKTNGNPWIYALFTDKINFTNDKIIINDAEFSSPKLRTQLLKSEAHAVILIAVSAGKECEEKTKQLWLEGKPDEYFFLEIYGSAVVEYLVTYVSGHICAWAEENKFSALPHYSPGYPGWDIRDQSLLLKIIRQNRNGSFPGAVEAFETGMLNPKKSLLGVFGITKHKEKTRNLLELIPCQACSMPSCNYRRSLYKHYRNQIEDVHKLQPQNNNALNEKTNSIKNEGRGKLKNNANYSVNLKALEKWSKERLKLKVLEDNSAEAVFHYEGSTCSNMGHPLEFDYFIKTRPASEGYKLSSLNCKPSIDNDGYTYMCEYIRDSETLMSNIENEKPLLGKQLNEILNWKFQFSPEGCFCKSYSREHKWGLVLEVLHFALVQYESKTINIENN
jgi:hypothetical protein